MVTPQSECYLSLAAENGSEQKQLITGQALKQELEFNFSRALKMQCLTRE
jgi:hypothetical protein